MDYVSPVDERVLGRPVLLQLRKAFLRRGELLAGGVRGLAFGGLPVGAARQGRRLGRREPGGEMVLHRLHPRDVAGGVEPQPARGAGRLQEVVAALPRTQELRTHTGAAAELADPEQPDLYHGPTIQDLDNDLTRRPPNR